LKNKFLKSNRIQKRPKAKPVAYKKKVSVSKKNRQQFRKQNAQKKIIARKLRRKIRKMEKRQHKRRFFSPHAYGNARAAIVVPKKNYSN